MATKWIVEVVRYRPYAERVARSPQTPQAGRSPPKAFRHLDVLPPRVFDDRAAAENLRLLHRAREPDQAEQLAILREVKPKPPPAQQPMMFDHLPQQLPPEHLRRRRSRK